MYNPAQNGEGYFSATNYFYLKNPRRLEERQKGREVGQPIPKILANKSFKQDDETSPASQNRRAWEAGCSVSWPRPWTNELERTKRGKGIR
jgi:hypothetical protein